MYLHVLSRQLFRSEGGGVSLLVGKLGQDVFGQS